MKPEGDGMPSFSIAILAGGESSRMGRNKALEPLGGKPVIAHVIDSLARLSGDLFIVGGDVVAYESFGLPVCADHYNIRSSLVGIYSALAASRHHYCFTVACDMPFVETRLVRMLMELAPGRDAVVPVSARGPEPLHAVYSKACLGRLRERIESGQMAINDLLEGLDVRFVELDEIAPFCDPSMVFLNVNSVVELEEASGLVSRFEKRRQIGQLQETGPGMPPVICFVGRKDSGKTTFLEKLIPSLKERGIRVACIKHDVHGFTIDREGTDTWRLARVGASEVVISSPEGVASQQSVDAEKSLAELRTVLSAPADLVLAEGFKAAAADRIEISRSGCSEGLTCAESDLVAVISDRADAASTVPVFGLDDVEAVVNLLLIRYGLGKTAGPGARVEFPQVNGISIPGDTQ